MTSLDFATSLLRSRAGLKAEPASQARLARLLQESAKIAGVAVDSYVSILHTQPPAFDDLLDRVTVQHSGFFRDPAQFDALAALVRQHPSQRGDVRSTVGGNVQEPHTLVMPLNDS